MAGVHALRTRWALVVGLAIGYLGCTQPRPIPEGSSDWYRECAFTCAAEGRDVKGIAETANATVCYCGKILIPESSWWPNQRRPSVLPAEWPFYHPKRRAA